MLRRKIKTAVGFSLLLLLIVIFLEKDKIYIGYIKLSKNDAIINHYNSHGQLNGEIVGYVDGNIDIVTNFRNGLREGLTTVYYKNGQIKNLSFFKHNQRVGEEVEYYNNGKIDYKRTWKNNKGYGSIYHYSEDGNILNYDALDVVNLFFYLEYDKTGKTTKALGSCFSSNLFSHYVGSDSSIVLNNNQSYKNINDLNITVATPPKLTTHINILINNKPIVNTKIENNTVTINNILLHQGVYNIKIIGRLINQNGGIVKADTLAVRIIKN